MRLDKAFKQLLMKRPFYGLFALSLSKRVTDRIPTLAVCRKGINCELLVNEKFWETLSDDEQIAVLQHELMHICMKHITMQDSFANHKMFNIAADAEINGYIENLPESAIKASQFGMEDGLGTRAYYEYLLSQENNQNQDDKNSKNGSGAGNGQMPDWNDLKDKIGDHDPWKDFKGLTESEKQLVEQQIDHIAKATAEQVQKMQGTIPGELGEYIGELFKPKPQIFNWKAYFRRFIGTINDTTLRRSRKKESIRFPDASGIKYRKKTNILIAIDTSGSVNNQELCDFFSEINHIYRAGANIEIIECDTRITNQYKYTGKFDGNVTGRGGTYFEPVVDYYNKHRKDYTMLIYFTDGGASIENIHPLKDMMWVITSGGLHQDYPGKVVYIPEENK